ncbi:hypothetical protein WA026_003450 [Henosepilachna vigintioctopunctata]|uniref:Uncharacterized protein n=1 Tax=Henosepilachna vigintioctopunctata TaxID=420089 RepID=A0AAW1THI8_9CUCU
MNSRHPVTISKHLKFPNMKLNDKDQISVKHGSDYLKKLMEDTNLLLDSKVSLVSLISLKDNCFLKNIEKLSTKDKVTANQISNDKQISRMQKKKSKLVNCTPCNRKKSGGIQLNEQILDRVKSCGESKKASSQKRRKKPTTGIKTKMSKIVTEMKEERGHIFRQGIPNIRNQIGIYSEISRNEKGNSYEEKEFLLASEYEIAADEKFVKWVLRNFSRSILDSPQDNISKILKMIQSYRSKCSHGNNFEENQTEL